jgi:hypothetical protein
LVIAEERENRERERPWKGTRAVKNSIPMSRDKIGGKRNRGSKKGKLFKGMNGTLVRARKGVATTK